MTVRKTRLRPIGPNDKLIIDDETGMVVGIAPDARTPASRLMVMGSDLTINAAAREELRLAGVMVADENGDYLANIGHRTGLLVALMAIDGVPGEIAIPTDVNGFVVYNGVVGQAKFIPRLDNPEALGPGSLAIGPSASTVLAASNAIAIGQNAKARWPGEYVQGAQKLGISRSMVMLHAITTNATAKAVGPDVGGLFLFPTLAGLYDVTVTAFVRDGYLNQWQKMTRNILFAVADDQTTGSVVGENTPNPDQALGLAGCTLSFLGGAGSTFIVNVTGLAARTLNWGVFVDIKAFNEDVLL